MRYHPDRAASDTPEAVETAAFRMREINDAWAVLRSPAARARYDDELRSAREGSARADTDAGRPVGTSEAERRARSARLREQWTPPVADLLVDDVTTTGARSGSWRAFLPVVILGAILLAVVIVTAYAGGDPDSAKAPDVQMVEQFGVGTCVVRGFGPDGAADASAVERDGTQAKLRVLSVPCTTPASATVVSRVPVPRPCPSSTMAWAMPESPTEFLCVRPNR
jgi:hypothetical protein